MTATAADTLRCTSVKETETQRLDLSARTLGTTALAPKCAVLEWSGGDYVYSLEGVWGEASDDFDAISWTTALPASCVSYAHTNTAGEVDVLLLKNVTGNNRAYGKLTIYSDRNGINLGDGDAAANNPAATIRNSGGASGCTRVTGVQTLTELAVPRSAFFTQGGKWYAECGGVEYPVSDAVELRVSGVDTWAKGTDALVSLLTGGYAFTAYYDAAPSDGGQIRIIVVS